MSKVHKPQRLSFHISKDRQITTELPAFIAGIINVTPDSFCPVGKCTPQESVMYAAEKAAETALKLVENGADIIDLGAESTRPGATPISEEEELARIVPAVRAIRRVTDCPVSIDTTKAAVMKAALSEGADILNDVSALENDKMMTNVAIQTEIPVILMHNHDILKVKDTEVVALVAEQLSERVLSAMNDGIAPERLILDPGVGFGKTLEQNLLLMRSSCLIRDRVLALTGLDGENLFPVMMALSRKSSIGMVTGRKVKDRLAGTLAADLIAVQQGATFLRVHDVAETCDMLKMMNALKKEGMNDSL